MGSPYVDLNRPPLRVAELRRALLRPDGFFQAIEVVDETGSTNADLRQAALDGAPEGTVLVAEHQNAGQGRLTRTWSSPPRAGLTFSVLLRPTTVPTRRWTWMPLLTGCAIVGALDTAAGLHAGLKWPNDVLIDERKLCGVLHERVETPSGPALLAGIGLNVSNTADELPSPAASSLVLAGAREADRSTVLRALLREFADRYVRWRDAEGDPDAGEPSLRAAYRSVSTSLGTRVRVEVAAGADSVEGHVEGTARDIDDQGRLIVDTDQGELCFGAGDVVHVRLAGRG